MRECTKAIPREVGRQLETPGEPKMLQFKRLDSKLQGNGDEERGQLPFQHRINLDGQILWGLNRTQFCRKSRCHPCTILLLLLFFVKSLFVNNMLFMKHQVSTFLFGLSSLIILLGSWRNPPAYEQPRIRGVAVGAASGAVIGSIIGNNVGKRGNTALGLWSVRWLAVRPVSSSKDGPAGTKIKTAWDPGAKVERVEEGST